MVDKFTHAVGPRTITDVKWTDIEGKLHDNELKAIEESLTLIVRKILDHRVIEWNEEDFRDQEEALLDWLVDNKEYVDIIKVLNSRRKKLREIEQDMEIPSNEDHGE